MVLQLTHPMHVIMVAIGIGLIAVVADIIIRQAILQQTIERKHIPEECKQYRLTKEHFVSVFIVAFGVALMMYWLTGREC